MKRSITIYITLLFLSFSINIWSHEDNVLSKISLTDTLKTKYSDSTKQSIAKQKTSASFAAKFKSSPPFISSALGLENYTPKTKKVVRSFPDLDKELLHNQAFQIAYDENFEPEFNEAYLEEYFFQDEKADTLKGRAAGLIKKLEEIGNFVDILTGNKLLELPVGLRKTDPKSGNEIVIAVSSVRFHPQYSELKLWAKLDIPQSDKSLYFGAEGIKFSHDGALIGDAKLVLLGDFPIAFNGNNWLLTLKGGINLQTGNFADKSFIAIDCEGLKEISLEGNLKVSRNVLIPLDDKKEPVCGRIPDSFPEDYEGDTTVQGKCYVQTAFSVKAAGWNDVLIDVSIPDFEVTGFKEWAFHIENAVLDLSDTRNSPNVTLPGVYNNLLPGGDTNLWRGIYAKEVSVTLPKAFEKISGNDNRATFQANDLILDSYGVSGKFSATNLFDRGDGAVGKWGFSIDSLAITLEVNTLVGGAIAGDIKVPIMKQPLGYEGWIAPEEYGLSVKLQEEYDVPVFLGKMTLQPNSSVSIKSIDGNIYPSANLTGILTVKGAIDEKASDTATAETTDTSSGETSDNSGDETASDSAKETSKGFVFRGIVFEELELQTEPGKPYIKAKKFGFDGEFKMLFFPVTVSNMELVTPSNTTAGLKFDLALNLDKKGAGAETTMTILGNLGENSRLHDWKFDKVAVSRINIGFTRGGVKLKGGLELMNNDPTYGDGLKGDITATIEKINLEIGGKAMFGAKPIEGEEDDFRYWFVDAWKKKTSGGDGNFLINSFMGGISYHMKRTNEESFWTPSNATYEPNKEYGLGLRAGVGIGTKGKTAFAGRAVLEMEFNTHGGLNRIGFIGEGAFMTKDEETTELPEKLKKLLGKIEAFERQYPDLYKKLNSNGNYLDASREAIPVNEIAASGKVGVYVGIERDFTTNTFHGEFELYLSLSGLRGAGPSNKAGYAVIHSSPDEWYLHIGTPTDRLGLVFGLSDSVELEVGGYFMTGDLLPTQLAPHPRVLQILGHDILGDNRRGNELSRGKGFAFGLNFAFRKSFQYFIFYATLEVGAGFDVMHRYYPDARCKGRSGPVGNDGWYSMGNVYAWLYGEFGVRVKLLFFKKKIKIAEAGIAALLHGQFPNPSYFRGYVGMHFSILGGLVKGRLRLKVTLGEECELVDINPFVDVPIISDLTPINGSDDVDVFTAPQAVFNYSIGQVFSIDTEEGYQTFKIDLNRFVLESGGQPISGHLEWNTNKDAVTFIPDEVLPPKKQVKAVVEVSFQEKVNGTFQVVTKAGKPILEKLESTFTTDLAPDHIPLENIAYMYPVLDQDNMYPREYNKGYVKLSRGQSYLFNGGYTIKAQTISQSGTATRTNLNYDIANKTVLFDLTDMDTSSNYTIDVMAFPPGENVETEIIVEETTTDFDEASGDTSWYNPDTGGTQTENTSGSVTVANKKAANVTVSNAEPKSLLSYTFNTSEHRTFKDKMRSITIVDNVTEILAADVHAIHLKLQKYENFDIAEVLGTRYSGGEPMVYGEAILKDNYYKRSIYPLNYEQYPLDGNITVNRDANILGVPPVRGLDVPNWYSSYLVSDPTSDYVTKRYPLMYNLPYHYKEDFLHLQYTIVNRYLNNGSPNQATYDKYKYLIEGIFPAIPLGSYRTYLIYRTPGNIHTNRYEVKFIND